MKQILDQAGLDSDGPFPMIRGRLIRIDEKEVVPEEYESPRAQRLATRDFNLSHARQVQSDTDQHKLR